MKRSLFIPIIALFTHFSMAQGLFKSTSSKVSFYSHTPLEDIEAISDKATAVINPTTNQLAFVVPNTSLVFHNSLMQEHFNEKYMESAKYPKSTFSGKITEKIDWATDGEYPVSVVGKLNIHGVEMERTIKAVIAVKKGIISAKSEFFVKTADHKIEVPKLVWEKIAEEMKVNVSAELAAQ